ncbi:MAG: hypothetical protein K0Q66_2335 [Chitinophagaceae bacterium]|jgi:hypothetical protein|nr:hypothetical protein [Chitinophagaceae bacterium]
MRQLINIINQVFEIEKKLSAVQPATSIQRNIDRIKAELDEMGYSFHNPIHERYDATRTDCEASITGNGSGKMKITDVVKPVIRCNNQEGNRIIQKAIVVVE